MTVKRFSEKDSKFYDDGSVMQTSDVLWELNSLHDRNTGLADENWQVKKILIEYDTTDKYETAEEVIEAIKKAINLRMIE